MTDDVAAGIAQRALAKRHADYLDEVRRLLDAALALMSRGGGAARPRVADIVAAAGLSNDAFYRHFPTKDALVVALLEDGAQRLSGYVAHRMAQAAAPQEQVRHWVEAVLGQAAAEIAATARAVLWNAGSAGEQLISGHSRASALLAALLREPFAALGSADPELDAALAAHAVVGLLSDYLWRRAEPTATEVDRVTRYCLRAVTSIDAGQVHGWPTPSPAS